MSFPIPKRRGPVAQRRWWTAELFRRMTAEQVGELMRDDLARAEDVLRKFAGEDLTDLRLEVVFTAVPRGGALE